MTGDPIPDADCVLRYCKPSTIEGGTILPNAFTFRDGEDHVSVNWIEYLSAPDLESAIDMVREIFRRKNYHISCNGRFAVVNVGAAKRVVRAVIGRTPQVEHLPEEDDASHAGIYGYSAAELAASQTQDTHGDNDMSLEDYATIETDAANRIAILARHRMYNACP